MDSAIIVRRKMNGSNEIRVADEALQTFGRDWLYSNLVELGLEPKDLGVPRYDLRMNAWTIPVHRHVQSEALNEGHGSLPAVDA